jgi:uncharacterized protein with beta-barrel porin domain
MAGAVKVINTNQLVALGDFSSGIVAQSLGGGGGFGGSASGGLEEVFVPLSGSIAAQVGIGGKGMGGGAAGSAVVTNSGLIVTDGFLADGILAQAIGGGGGIGGAAQSGVTDLLYSKVVGAVNLSVGGGGGNAGDGGNVPLAIHVTNSADILTLGPLSTAILAQSIGGGGGVGGSGSAGVSGADLLGNPSSAPGSSIQLGGGIGGGGGSSGSGKDVMVNNNTGGTLFTFGFASPGIVAQSIGGGGGVGGDGSSSGASTGGLITLNFALGGTGGSAGDAGAVTITNSASISTVQDLSGAIVAQSIGGGGGLGGGGGTTAGGAGDQDPTIYIGAGVGGSGKAGGTGGAVSVTSDANVMLHTTGFMSPAILAQSIGGGGGDGGSGTTSGGTGNYSLRVGLGGSGGSAGIAQAVNVMSSSTIETSGNFAGGILAQSIGGGGGFGGGGGSTQIGTNNATLNLGAGIGLGGGAGRDSGAVTVDAGSGGSILTKGTNSPGILAQSIGGGGGAAGAGSNDFGPGQFAINLALGAGGGVGGNAGTVTVTNVQPITTQKDLSDAILAQSIGGGGGASGTASNVSVSGNDTATLNIGAGISLPGGAAGNGGAVTVTTDQGALKTSGFMSSGIVAQSIGGGGGNGGTGANATAASQYTINLGLGGSGGSAGTGSNVEVDSTSIIITKGDLSTAILAQSIGGGGGTGGAGDTTGIGSDKATLKLGAGIGLGGGAGRDAGTVTINTGLGGGISTVGFNSAGIVAQSVGGGGGAAGAGSSVTGSGQYVVNFALGAHGGVGGNGNTVLVNNFQNITTQKALSDAILAESIGGGGGVGGAGSATGGAATGSSATLNIGAGIGLGGGAAGNGGAVSVTTESSALTTNGFLSGGVIAQSIGAGGGMGGAGTATGGGAQYNIILGLGGSGGSGGTGGDVTVNSSSVIVTRGNLSPGILAQSIGGGGGAGGAGGNDGAGGNTATLNLGAGIGLSGGAAGDGGGVIVNTKSGGGIMTGGENSPGIIAQSVGAGGGFGGAGSSQSGAGQFSLGLGLGGHGGSSGNGMAVTVDNFQVIMTTGASSHGILAQSVGGGGGAGGGGSTSGAAGDGGVVNLGAGIGLGGGAGGNSGLVTVTNEIGGAISTTGVSAFGIFAQSVGGGGGYGGLGIAKATGGTVGVTLALGGGGGNGGDGGGVTVTNSGKIMTSNNLANAIFAQSIGGGGGSGGGAGADNSAKNVVSLSLGMSGGNGGFGGDVKIVNNASGMIATMGTSAYGIFAQSVGGGGGFAGAGSNTTSGGDVSVTLSIGGKGGVGNKAGTVDITNDGLISTNGALAYAVFAQSIGGGGGTGAGASNSSSATINVGGGFGGGGAAGGDGNTVAVNNSGQIITTGKGAIGIFAQSIGGGGGNGATATATSASDNSVAIAVGGRGGAGGKGGDVIVNVTGSITTSGDQANGVFAQSVGGGGGYGSDASGKAGGGLAVGGNGGSGGDGGNVTVIRTGTITTTGRDSTAIIAQSVGGGGGFAGAGVGRFTTFPVAVGGAPGSKGVGGVVTVIQRGDIMTNGARSHGIFGQSVGGGGGAGGPDPPPTESGFAGSNGGIGNAAPVNLTMFGNIAVLGPGSYGMFGQSAAGIGNGSDVTLHPTKDVIATGLDSIAIYGQSTGTLGRGNIIITTDPNTTILGGSGAGVAVGFVGGLNNLLLNAATLSALSGLAISGTDGNDAVDNTGVVIGSIDLDGGVNAFDNKPSGSFLSGPTVNLGPLGLLTNEGLLSPGGLGNVITTNVTGSFLQTSTGTYALDLQFLDQTSDRINVTGTASAAGTVSINILNPGLALTGSHDVIIVSAAGGVTSHAGLGLSHLPTAVATYSLTYPNPNDIVLHYKIDFSPSGLTGNEHAVGNAINRIQLARVSPNFVPIAARLFYVPTVADLGSAYDSISGEGTAAIQQTTFSARNLFFETVMRNGWLPQEPLSDTHVLTSPGDKVPVADKAPISQVQDCWRAWASGFGSTDTLDGGTSAGSAKTYLSGAGGAAGLDYRINAHLALGITACGSDSSYSVPDRTTHGYVSGGGIGLYAAGRWNKLYVTGVLAYGAFSNTERRDFVGAFIGPQEQSSGSFQSNAFGGRVELGWDHRVGPITLTPFVALQFDTLWTNGYSETTTLNGSKEAGILGLRFASRSVTSVPLFLGAQVDGTFGLAGGRTLTPFVRAAWLHEFNAKREVSADFLAAPGFPFQVEGAQAAQDSAQIQAGLTVGLSRTVSLLTSFVGDFSGVGNSYGGYGGIKISW